MKTTIVRTGLAVVFEEGSTSSLGTTSQKQIKCRLLPSFARSVGFGPVFCPQKLLLSNYRPLRHETNQFFRNERANPRPRNGPVARLLLPASRTGDSSKSCQSHTRVAEAAFPRGMPLRNTNKILTKHRRSDRRGLPPFGFGFATGMKGAISFHNWSERSAAAIEIPPKGKNITCAEMTFGGKATHYLDVGFVRGC